MKDNSVIKQFLKTKTLHKVLGDFPELKQYLDSIGWPFHKDVEADKVKLFLLKRINK